MAAATDGECLSSAFEAKAAAAECTHDRGCVIKDVPAACVLPGGGLFMLTDIHVLGTPLFVSHLKSCCLSAAVLLRHIPSTPHHHITELERLRVEVHGFHLELAALQVQLSDKDALLQRALGDASQLDAERGAAAERAEEATQAALSLERQLREAQQALQEVQKAKTELTEKLAAVEARAEGLQSDQTRWLRAEGGLRAQLQEVQEQQQDEAQQRGQLQQQLKEAAQREADATRCVFKHVVTTFRLTGD